MKIALSRHAQRAPLTKAILPRCAGRLSSAWFWTLSSRQWTLSRHSRHWLNLKSGLSSKQCVFPDFCFVHLHCSCPWHVWILLTLSLMWKIVFNKYQDFILSHVLHLLTKIVSGHLLRTGHSSWCARSNDRRQACDVFRGDYFSCCVVI